MDHHADRPHDAVPERPKPDTSPFARLSALNAAQPTPSTNGTHPATGMGRLQRVDAGQLWPTDADLAAWLADNLDTFAESVSPRLTHPELLEGELPVVLAATADGASAVVLAQRGASTDDAFGALVRHFAASAARHAVWVCGRPSSEHAAAVSWLNRVMDGRFLLVRVAGATIGDSATAPTFDAVVRPARAVDPHVTSSVPAAADHGSTRRRAEDWIGQLHAGTPAPTTDPTETTANSD